MFGFGFDRRQAVTAAFLSMMCAWEGQAQLRFEEGAAKAGITFRHVSGTPEKTYILESMSGGAAVFDADGDGRMDIYWVNGNSWEALVEGRRSVSNALYLNNGDGTFRDDTRRAGVTGGVWDMGAAAADLDNDGDVDLFVSGYRGNRLYLNDGKGVFRDASAASGIDSSGWSTGIAFGDYDSDGLLDLFVAGYVEFDPAKPPERTPLCRYRGVDVQCGPRGLPGRRDALYRNLGQGRFQDVSASAGILTESTYYGLGAAWLDYDNDGDPDLFVANDSCPNFLFRNEGGRFTEVAMVSGIALNENGVEQAGMGIALGDPDNDGWLDLVQTNFADDKNTLYQNFEGTFVDAGYTSNIGEVSWPYLGWGTVFFDADWDGFEDLFIANGHVYPEVDSLQIGSRYRQRDFVFHNLGNASFKEVGREAGLQEVENSRGVAAGDFDDDGRIDIVVTRLDGPPALYWNRSETQGRHWIGFDLEGTTSNRSAIGARVTVRFKERTLTRETAAGGSYISSHDPRLVFGLGDATPTAVEIRWPDGRKQTLKDFRVDAYNAVKQPR